MSHATGYLTVDAINGAIDLLVAAHPATCSKITIGRSDERRDIQVLKVGQGTRGVLLIGGMHAREFVNPDLLMTLAAQLAAAYDAGTGLTYSHGATTVTRSATMVRLLVENLAIYFLPVANPDGRVHAFSSEASRLWRKTRNRNPGSTCRGVDLNRHFDLLWSSGIGSSTDPCPYNFATTGVDSGDGVYKGHSPIRQPEAKAIESFLDDHPNVHCLVDVHSYSNCIIYPWGHNPNQTSDPTMAFTNPAWDGLRTDDTTYAEYIDPDDLYVYERRAAAIRSSIAELRGTTYKTGQGWHFIDAYRTSGTVDAWAYSRHLADPSKPRIGAWALETGSASEGFQPLRANADSIIDEVSLGLLTLLVRCMCPIELLLRDLFGRSRETTRMIKSLQSYRDQQMLRSAAGRRWVAALEDHSFDLLMAAKENERTRELLRTVIGSASEVAATWDSKRPRKFTVALIDDARRLATHVKRNHPELRSIVSELQPDLEGLTGLTPKGALRQAAEKRAGKKTRGSGEG
jgi:hypothetical protein